MEDSLEDFIRITRNCKEGPTVKNEVLISAQTQKECDTKAMQILQFAIEGKMRSDALFRCLPFINQDHYQDIVEERAISKLCGYPLCSKRIPDMPKKQFYISTKSNKVYDITERKNFCSNFCYRASIHLRNQVDTSPLWQRNHSEKTQFTLLNKTEKGLPGELVDQGILKTPVEPLFTSVSAFAQMSLDEAEELELTPEEKQPKKQPKKPKKFQKKTMKTINENEEEVEVETPVKKEKHIETESSPEKSEKNPSSKPAKSCNKDSQISSDIKVKEKTKTPMESCNKDSQTSSDKKVEEKTETSFNSDFESHIYKCFKEWLSLETYSHIFGEEEIKGKLNSETLGDYFDSLKVAKLQVEQQKRYVNICRKLHLKELADEKFDQAVVGNQRLNPIPDYQELKDQSRKIDIKVKSFYLGELYEQADPNFPTTKNKDEEANYEAEGAPAVLPMGHLTSQNALRRKIFLTSLNRTVQVMSQNLKMSPSSVFLDMQALVKTFKLKANNIVFKAPQWNIIAIILFKILSIRDENMREILETENSKHHFSLWLSSLPHKDQLVEDVLKILDDVDRFVKEYITCT